MCVALSVSRCCRCLLALVVVLLLNTLGCLSCNRNMGYRNFWVELYSTSPCGDVGEAPIGVCSMATTCSVMSGESLGTYNCPVTSSTCCRPVATCDATSVALNLLWESESYSSNSQLQPSTCTLNVVPSADTCYIKVDFDDMDIESISVDHCGYSYLRINSQEQGDSQKICGTLNHKTTFVKVGTHLTGLPVPVEFNLRMGHAPHKYSAKFNHVKCSDIKKFRNNRRHRSASGGVRRAGSKRRTEGRDIEYMGRMFAISYTREPLIRSCPVTFIAEDIVIGAASCTLRLGGPGISKGLMVVHGALHKEPRSEFPKTVSSLARYVANNGVVVRSTVFHPMYNHDTHENDIAVYFLNKTVKGVEPVLLPVPIDDFVELSVYLARYHYFDVSDEITIMTDPEELVTKVVSNSECHLASIPRVSDVTSNNTICIAPTPRENAPCSGEIGSPIVHIGGSGTITLLGLMMGGYHHCDGKHSYAEPAIKIINYLDFIDVATSPSFIVPRPSSTGSSLTRWYSNWFG